MFTIVYTSLFSLGGLISVAICQIFLSTTKSKQLNSYGVQRNLKFGLPAAPQRYSFIFCHFILFKLRCLDFPGWEALHRLLWVALKVLMAGLASVVAELLLKRDTTLPFTVHLGQAKSSLQWSRQLPMFKTKNSIVIPAFFTNRTW